MRGAGPFDVQAAAAVAAGGASAFRPSHAAPRSADHLRRWDQGHDVAVPRAPARAVVPALPRYAVRVARDAEKPTLTGEAIPLITTRKSDNPSTADSTGKV